MPHSFDPSDGLLMSSEHECREDQEAGGLGGFGGAPDPVEVIPPVLVAGAEGQEEIRGREQQDGRESLDGERVVEFFRAECDPGQVLVDFLLSDIESRHCRCRLLRDFPKVCFGRPAVGHVDGNIRGGEQAQRNAAEESQGHGKVLNSGVTCDVVTADDSSGVFAGGGRPRAERWKFFTLTIDRHEDTTRR
jgi:hypothetical protein